MLSQNPSQIYKAQLRFHDEDETYRCLATFNNESHFDESRKPFGKLKMLSDETLAGGQIKSFTSNEKETVILIPLVGTIDYDDNFGNRNYIETEEIQILESLEASQFHLRNPYEKELINYLQLRLDSVNLKNSFEKRKFDFSTQNELFMLLENENHTISIGIFTGRSEGVYHLKNDTNGAFAFIINGAFEFQNRLLESRDALAIWNVSEIEFEALSENAILLVIETSMQ